jgi:hypothetical protein
MCISKTLQTLTRFPLANVETHYSRQLYRVKKSKVKNYVTRTTFYVSSTHSPETCREER